MKSVEEYLKLPYRIALTPDVDEDGASGWVAEVDELPGCISQGRTAEEAVDNVRDAMAGWISVALDDGQPIPEPRAAQRYSGRFLLRVPATLHAELAQCAEREGVSINQFASSALAGAVGWRRERELVR